MSQKHCHTCATDKPSDKANWYHFKGQPKQPCKTCSRRKNTAARLARGSDATSKLNKQYYRNNMSDINLKCRTYYEQNAASICQAKRASRAATPGINAAYQRALRKRDPERFRKYDIKRRAQIERRLSNLVRSRIWDIVKRRGTTKSLHTIQITGWSIKELMCHLEELFEEGMTFENIGEWQLDHIFPLGRLAFSDVSDPRFQKAWALSNLAPLWSGDNSAKSDRLDWNLPDTYKNKKLKTMYEVYKLGEFTHDQ